MYTFVRKSQMRSSTNRNHLDMNAVPGHCAKQASASFVPGPCYSGMPQLPDTNGYRYPDMPGIGYPGTPQLPHNSRYGYPNLPRLPDYPGIGYSQVPQLPHNSRYVNSYIPQLPDYRCSIRLQLPESPGYISPRYHKDEKNKKNLHKDSDRNNNRRARNLIDVKKYAEKPKQDRNGRSNMPELPDYSGYTSSFPKDEQKGNNHLDKASAEYKRRHASNNSDGTTVMNFEGMENQRSKRNERRITRLESENAKINRQIDFIAKEINVMKYILGLNGPAQQYPEEQLTPDLSSEKQ